MYKSNANPSNQVGTPDDGQAIYEFELGLEPYDSVKEAQEIRSLDEQIDRYQRILKNLKRAHKNKLQTWKNHNS